MRRLATSLAALVLSSGCVINLGTGREDVSAATSPNGTPVEVRVRESREIISGELLDVREDALVVLAKQQVVLIPFSLVDRARYHDAPVLDGQGNLGAQEKSHLRMYSRFPNGIAPSVMAELLRALGQDAPRVPRA